MYEGSALRQEVCVASRRHSKLGLHRAHTTEHSSSEGRRKFSDDFASGGGNGEISNEQNWECGELARK